MSDEYVDPSGNTAQFKAFADREEPAPAKAARPVGVIIGGVAAAIVLLAIVVYLTMS